MTPPTTAQIEKALKDVTALKSNQVVEVIKNPGDLQNTLNVVVECLTVLSVFFPQVAAVEDLIALLADFIPLIEAGGVAFNLHFPTPDPDPMHDAQMSTGR